MTHRIELIVDDDDYRDINREIMTEPQPTAIARGETAQKGGAE